MRDLNVQILMSQSQSNNGKAEFKKGRHIFPVSVTQYIAPQGEDPVALETKGSFEQSPEHVPATNERRVSQGQSSEIESTIDNYGPGQSMAPRYLLV